MVKSNKKISTKKSIYLDFASSYLPNPGAIHDLGVKSKLLLEKARLGVANFLGARSNEIIFTASGTEANNLALMGFVRALKKEFNGLPHVITTNIEHLSVLEPLKTLDSDRLINLTVVPVHANGLVDVKDIKKAITKDTVLISVMHANNEIGTIQPVLEISKLVRHFKKHSGQKIYLHTDATQMVSTLPIRVEKLGVDLLTFSGAKLEGGLGVGVLYRKVGVPLLPIIYGGGQEFGLRPGTENLSAISSLARTLKKLDVSKEEKRLMVIRDYFLKKASKERIFKDCGVLFNGDLISRLASNINITFPKIPSELLVIELSACGIMVSSKSACKNTDSEGSYVIYAISSEIPKDIGGLRISIGDTTSKKDMDYLIKSLSRILLKLKEWYN